MKSIATAVSTINVPFHGAELYVVNHNGEPYTPMKPIVEGMGMDWASQFTKLKQRFAKGIVEIAIPSVGGVQTMICLALRKLNGWLQTISPNKVRPEIRDNVIMARDVLINHTRDVDINEPDGPTNLSAWIRLKNKELPPSVHNY
ncbi:hypothetical protein HUC08_21170 [Escherichia coli]|nr:hypothetical protein [Escherichia coli]NUE34472.1 hypothetical protein [Escherichia coli]NUE47638.1 hypothetical protein [Escherichia coli]